MAGLKSDMTTSEQCTDTLVKMMARRASAIQDLIMCVARLENLEILNKKTLKQEIESYTLVKQRIGSMDADTDGLVRRVPKVDSMLTVLTTFTNYVKVQETQINENYAKFEKAKKQKMARIQQ